MKLLDILQTINEDITPHRSPDLYSKVAKMFPSPWPDESLRDYMYSRFKSNLIVHPFYSSSDDGKFIIEVPVEGLFPEGYFPIDSSDVKGKMAGLAILKRLQQFYGDQIEKSYNNPYGSMGHRDKSVSFHYKFKSPDMTDALPVNTSDKRFS